MTQAGRYSLLLLIGLLLMEALLLVGTALYQRESFSVLAGRTEPDFLFNEPVSASSVFQRVSGKTGAVSAPATPMAFSKEEKTYLQLVNKENHLDASYEPQDLQPIKYYAEDRSPEGRYMRAAAAEQFHLMVDAAARKGLKIRMTTAYRSYGFQKVLWENYSSGQGEAAANTFSAKPGESEHQTGLAVDITSPSVGDKLSEEFGKTAEGKWLAENAHLYGFILRYPKGSEALTGYQYEPWHYRYVGKKAAAEIYRRNVTFEEFYAEVFNAAAQ